MKDKLSPILSVLDFISFISLVIILPPPSLYTLHMMHLCSPEQQTMKLYSLLSHQRAFQAREAVKIRLFHLDVLSVPGLRLNQNRG